MKVKKKSLSMNLNMLHKRITLDLYIRAPLEIIIYDKKGNFSGGVMVYKDIESRLALEGARLIKTQNKLLSKVVQALDLEFIRCSYTDFKIISINGSSFISLREKIYGTKCWVSPIGENYFDVYPINEEQKRRDLHYNLIQKKKTSFIDYAAHIVDGEQRFLRP